MIHVIKHGADETTLGNIALRRIAVQAQTA
jgi:hypothetical protein